MKIKIIPENCIGCGLCHLYSPNVFDYHDDGVVKFYNSDHSVQTFSSTSELLTAVKSCPTAALQILLQEEED